MDNKLQKEHEAYTESSGFIADDAPPQYDNNNRAESPDAVAPPGYTPGPSPYEKVPIAWNLYYKTWSLRTYLVGSHADQPTFSLEIHSGLLASRPFLILFDGADSKKSSSSSSSSNRIAWVNREGLIRGHSVITVPGGITEKLTAHTTRFNFSFDVGPEGNKHREEFEWRYSHGKEVRVLDRWAIGWKLVRLGGGEGHHGGGSRSTRAHGESSDGLPVVAVFADNTKWSKTKMARFHFVGAGATDEFGEPWAMMVTMSALRIWELTMQASRAAAVA